MKKLGKLIQDGGIQAVLEWVALQEEPIRNDILSSVEQFSEDMHQSVMQQEAMEQSVRSLDEAKDSKSNSKRLWLVE
jgi:hypothetical protein